VCSRTTAAQTPPPRPAHCPGRRPPSPRRCHGSPPQTGARRWPSHHPPAWPTTPILGRAPVGAQLGAPRPRRGRCLRAQRAASSTGAAARRQRTWRGSAPPRPPPDPALAAAPAAPAPAAAAARPTGRRARRSGAGRSPGTGGPFAPPSRVRPAPGVRHAPRSSVVWCSWPVAQRTSHPSRPIRGRGGVTAAHRPRHRIKVRRRHGARAAVLRAGVSQAEQRLPQRAASGDLRRLTEHLRA
jgi:hypothetical protein